MSFTNKIRYHKSVSFNVISRSKMKMNSVFVTVFLFIILSEWIQPSVEVEIVNGKDADISEFPWLVTINWYTYLCPFCDAFNCGGTIIDKKWIITAAHCEVDAFYGGFLIRAGTNSPLWWGEKRYISRSIRHPNYTKTTQEHDIQLLELSEEFEYSNLIKPIRMADEYFNVTEDLNVKIAGFGKTCQDCSNSRRLLKAELTTCHPITKSVMDDVEEVLCAHDKNELQASE